MSKHFSYTTAFKLQVVDFAETNGNRITARHFGVDESNARLWKKSKLQLDKMPKSKRANRGRIAFYPNLEKQIIEWITDCRSQGTFDLPADSTIEKKGTSTVTIRTNGAGKNDSQL